MKLKLNIERFEDEHTLTLRALHGLHDSWGRFDFSRGGRGG